MSERQQATTLQHFPCTISRVKIPRSWIWWHLSWSCWTRSRCSSWESLLMLLVASWVDVFQHVSACFKLNLRFVQQLSGDGDINADPGQIWAESLSFKSGYTLMSRKSACVRMSAHARVSLILCSYGFLSLTSSWFQCDVPKKIFRTVQIGSEEENWYPLHASAWAFLPWQLPGQDIQAAGIGFSVNRCCIYRYRDSHLERYSSHRKIRKPLNFVARPLFHVFYASFLRCVGCWMILCLSPMVRWDWPGRERMTCTALWLILLRVNCAASRFLRAEPWQDLGRSEKEWAGSGNLRHLFGSICLDATGASFTLNIDILRPSHPWAPYRRPRLWRKTSSLEMLGEMELGAASQKTSDAPCTCFYFYFCVVSFSIHLEIQRARERERDMTIMTPTCLKLRQPGYGRVGCGGGKRQLLEVRLWKHRKTSSIGGARAPSWFTITKASSLGMLWDVVGPW